MSRNSANFVQKTAYFCSLFALFDGTNCRNCIHNSWSYNLYIKIYNFLGLYDFHWVIFSIYTLIQRYTAIRHQRVRVSIKSSLRVNLSLLFHSTLSVNGQKTVFCAVNLSSVNRGLTYLCLVFFSPCKKVSKHFLSMQSLMGEKCMIWCHLTVTNCRESNAQLDLKLAQLQLRAKKYAIWLLNIYTLKSAESLLIDFSLWWIEKFTISVRTVDLIACYLKNLIIALKLFRMKRAFSRSRLWQNIYVHVH